MLDLEPTLAAARQLAAALCPDGSPRCVAIVVVVLLVVALVRRASKPAEASAAPQLVDDLVDDVAGDERAAMLAELLDVVSEAAAHRYPGLHPDEALDRYVHDVASANHYYRDEARKKEAAAAAAKAEASAPASYTSAEFDKLFTRSERDHD